MTTCRPLNCTLTLGEFVVAGETFHRGAWCLLDLGPLFESPAFRGDSVLVEQEVGRQARSIVTDETDYSLQFEFSGAVDPGGVPYANKWGGLYLNRDIFHALYIDPIRAGTATLAAQLRVPDPDDPTGATFDVREAEVQPLMLRWGIEEGAMARAVLDLRIPIPVFTPTGSPGSP